VVAGIRFDPAPVIVGALAENFLAHHRDAQNLPEEVHHLLGPGQTAEIAVDDYGIEAVIDEGKQTAEQPGELFHATHYTRWRENTVGTRAIKRGNASQVIDGKDFRLADEIRYIQDKAAEYDLRVVTIGPLILFSTETGDAWLLDVTDKLAARLARDGDPEPIHLEETDTSFAIGWKGQYRIENHA